ncbi:MAG: hypothetical protein Q7R58_01075 [bacterium]|nr:hypothetical protein [bacterium]
MNISHSIRAFFSRLRSAAHSDPVRDWLTLLALSIFAFVSIVVWNIWAFDTVARGGVIGTAATSTLPAFNSSSMEAVQAVFLKRANEEAKYVTGVYRYADPSQ